MSLDLKKRALTSKFIKEKIFETLKNHEKHCRERISIHTYIKEQMNVQNTFLP